MEKTKKRFTVIDLLIILVVLAAIVIAGSMLLPKGGGGTKQEVSFTVMISGKEDGFADAIHIGDQVVLSYTEKDKGTITEVKAEPAKIMAYNSIDGKYSLEETKGKQDIYVTVTAKADVNDVSVKVGGTAVRVGGEMPVRGKGYATSGFVVDMNV